MVSSAFIPHHIMQFYQLRSNNLIFVEKFTQVVSARESVVKIDEAAAKMETTVILESETALSDLESQQL